MTGVPPGGFVGAPLYSLEMHEGNEATTNLVSELFWRWIAGVWVIELTHVWGQLMESTV